MLDGNLDLFLPETDKNSEGFNIETPITEVLKNKFFFKEILKNSGCLKSTLRYLIDKQEKWDRVGDAMAGVGFGGKILQKYLNPKKLYLNDLDERCCSILRSNFRNSIITQQDALNLDWPGMNLVNVDFNTFSIKRIPQWEGLFAQLAKLTDWITFTDTACFGFKFKKNFLTYGVGNADEYYQKLTETLFPLREFILCSVSKQFNSAVICLGKSGLVKQDWKYLFNEQVSCSTGLRLI
jgi:hypothetical protein